MADNSRIEWTDAQAQGMEQPGLKKSDPARARPNTGDVAAAVGGDAPRPAGAGQGSLLHLERAAREDVTPETRLWRSTDGRWMMDDSVTLQQREDVKAAMRLCKDCKHCRPDRFFAIIAPFGSKKFQYADCAYLKSPVDGSPAKTCSTMRSFSDLCGPEGRFWEKR